MKIRKSTLFYDAFESRFHFDRRIKIIGHSPRSVYENIPLQERIRNIVRDIQNYS